MSGPDDEDEEDIEAEVNEGREASEADDEAEIEDSQSGSHVEELADPDDNYPSDDEEPYIRDADDEKS